MTKVTAVACMASMLAGCNASLLPVPVEGTVEQLVGEWAGEFSSGETGRRGSIYFHLEAGRDTATGDILLVPDRTYNLPTEPDWYESHLKTSAHVLQISFVRCTDGEVDGWIKPYPDPDTGHLTHTDFSGVITGDSLTGTYVSRVEIAGKRSTGTWAVARIRK